MDVTGRRPLGERVLSERVVAVPPSGIRRFFDIVATMDDVISLGVGEPDFDTPRVIVEAGVESLREGRTHYTSNFGTLELRRALSRHLDARYGVRYDPASEILITVGASEAVDLALRATCDPGDEVILHEPSYVAYVPAIVFAGGVVRHVATRFEDDFALDPAAVEAAITPQTKALFLGYPCNPTGAVLPDQVQDALAEIAVRHDLLVYSDEIYDRLAYGTYRHRAMSALAGMRDRTILMGGFSKAYAMTGWRVGYVAGPAAILEGMVKVHQYAIMSAPTVAQDAALAAVIEGEPDVERMLAEYDRRRRLLVDGLNGLGLDTFEPRGAFYAFPRIVSTGLDDETFAERLLVEERVAVVPGSAFGPSGAGHVRMCYATSFERLEEALVRIGRFVARPRRVGRSVVVRSPTMTASTALDRYEVVIGVEVHCQLKTASKMFCSCSTDYDGAPPNTHCCAVCLGLPGALPTINRRAVEHVLATGAAIEASAPPATRWDRKNYFYPDLPKGYQISQYDLPLASLGRLTFDTSDGPFTVAITRAHLEEDTAKLVHATDADGRKVSLVDFNRSGAPLMEIVSEPDIRTAEQARRYAEELQLLLRSIGASDADMERGQLRVEANVSLRPRGTEPFGTRVEVKNMNSFRAVERAIAFEIERQAAALDTGEPLLQETRGWSEERGETYRMRVKETSHDYRYFPEPDLPPLHLDATSLAEVRAALPELPGARRGRYRHAMGLTPYDAAVLVADPDATALFEATLSAVPTLDPKPVANWVTGEYLRLRKAASDPVVVSPAELGAIIEAVGSGSISRAQGREVLEGHAASGDGAAAIITARGFHQISDSGELDAAVDVAIATNPAAVADYRAGKAQAVGFLVGQVMKATRGQANAALVQAAVRERLEAQQDGEG